MIPIIYPYKMGSSGAKLLARALGTKRVRPDGKYKPKESHLILNWGSSRIPEWLDRVGTGTWLNFPSKAKRAADKLETFRILSAAGVPTPEWTSLYDIAFAWWEGGAKVFIRTKLNGHSGDGIIITSVEDGQFEDVGFPLYTKDIGKRYEYRVHVFNGEVIDFQKKKRSRDGTKNDDIRSHENGWVFCRMEETLPGRVASAGKAAVQALGLRFGAVDVAYRARTDEAFVFEVNTAPGLEGKTLESYVNAIKKLLEGQGIMDKVEITPEIPADEVESGRYFFALLLRKGDKYERISDMTDCRSHLTDGLHYIFEEEEVKRKWELGAEGILLNYYGQAHQITDAKDNIGLYFYPGADRNKLFEDQFLFYIHKIEEKNGFKKTEIYRNEFSEDEDYDDFLNGYVLIPDPRWYADTILFSIYTFITKLMMYDLQGKEEFWEVLKSVQDRKDKKLVYNLGWNGEVTGNGQAVIWFPFIFNNLQLFSEGERHILGLEKGHKWRDDYHPVPYNIHGIFNFYEILTYENLPESQFGQWAYPNERASTKFLQIIRKAKGTENNYNMNFIKE